MKRRISWDFHSHIARVVFPSCPDVEIFSWKNLPLPLNDQINPVGKTYTFRPFEEDEDKLQLYWNGVPCETFLDETVLKVYLIRFVYNLDIAYSIPSEILADAQLQYSTGKWVDEFFSCKFNGDIIQVDTLIPRPPNRNIKLEGCIFPDQKNKNKPHYAPTKNTYSSEKIVKIEASLHFRKGGFYEKLENPKKESENK